MLGMSKTQIQKIMQDYEEFSCSSSITDLNDIFDPATCKSVLIMMMIGDKD